MSKKHELQQELLFSRCDTQGLKILLIGLTVQHARALGGDQKALDTVEAMLEKSLSLLVVKGEGSDGVSIDMSEQAQQRVKILLGEMMKDARRQLGVGSVLHASRH